MSIVLKDISFTLDPASIEKAARKLERTKDQLIKVCGELVQALVDSGVETAKELCLIPSSQDAPDIMRSIQGLFYRYVNVGYIYSDLPAAVYLEYGTGVMGKEWPHAGIESGESDPPIMVYLNANGDNRIYTTYDTYEHGLYGWFYVDRLGQLVRTNGQTAGQFMYNTFLELKEKAPGIMQDLLAKKKGAFR